MNESIPEIKLDTETSYIDEIPLLYRKAYYTLLNKLIAYYKDLIDDIIQKEGGNIKFPMDCSYIENYLTGYKVKYIGFESRLSGFSDLDGFFDFEEETGDILIYFKTNASEKRQLFTKIHELLHACQSLDIMLQNFLERLIRNSTLPEQLIKRLVEKSANKATAIYIMPNDYFINKYKQTKNIEELSDYFQASTQSIAYRLKECGLISSY